MNVETIATVPNCPSELGWLPDGRLLVVSMTDRRMLRQEPDATLVTHAELSRVAAYRSSIAAEDLEFPNGSVITPDGETLIVSKSMGRRLTAFTVAEDGSLSQRRVWADLGKGIPDDICLDAVGSHLVRLGGENGTTLFARRIELRPGAVSSDA